jgi:hypothetical protein
MLLQAFSIRFAVGILAASVTLPVHPVLAGAIVGLVVSLPDAFGLNSYFGVLGPVCFRRTDGMGDVGSLVGELE